MAILYITHDLGTVAKMCDRGSHVSRQNRGARFGNGYIRTCIPIRRLLGSVHVIGGRDRLFSIEGTVPLAMNLVDRCGFFERCTYRDEGICSGPEPRLVEVEDGTVACYLCDPAIAQQKSV